MENEDTEGIFAQRLMAIEAKLALAEDQLDALNLTAYRQEQQIDRLRREMRVLRDQVETVATATNANAPADELPPHY